MSQFDNIAPRDALAGQESRKQQIDDVGIARAHTARRTKYWQVVEVGQQQQIARLDGRTIVLDSPALPPAATM